MAYRFINIPIPVDIKVYEKAIANMTDKIVNWPSVKAVYQIGGISTPGISDLDMVVIFDDGATCPHNPRQNLSKSEQYLFAHNLYGTSVTLFYAAQNYTYFHNYKLLWGSDFLMNDKKKIKVGEKILKTQIALEYLVRLYINLVMQRTYKVYKIREIFLHINGVRYDLEFLEISSGRLSDLTESLIDIRNRWFDVKPTQETMERLLKSFFYTLVETLEHVMIEHGFYFRKQEHYVLGRINKLKNGPRIKYIHNGMLLPGTFSLLGPLYFKLQNRLGEFHFEFPIITDNIPDILVDRYKHAKEMKQYNLKNLFHFYPLVSSLDVL